jgi:predicted HAD superfamily Cof-like phosphohydrolase
MTDTLNPPPDNDPPVVLVKKLPTPRAYAEAFHRKLGYPVRDVPAIPSDEEVRYRLCFMWEEFRETMQACFDHNTFVALMLDQCQTLMSQIIGQQLTINLPLFVDGLADQDYVNEGTRLYFGVDGDPVMRLVHKANMQKVVDVRLQKAVKPPMWRAPDIEGELRRQGWGRSAD